MTVAMLLFCAQIACAQSGDGGKSKVDDSQAIADRIVESQIPVFIDFWAGWCMACRMQEPLIAELEKEYKGRVMFVRADVDIHKGLTRYFNITAMPSVFVIEDKTVRSSFVGMKDKPTYRDAINKALAMSNERKSK